VEAGWRRWSRPGEILASCTSPADPMSMRGLLPKTPKATAAGDRLLNGWFNRAIHRTVSIGDILYNRRPHQRADHPAPGFNVYSLGQRSKQYLERASGGGSIGRNRGRSVPGQ